MSAIATFASLVNISLNSTPILTRLTSTSNSQSKKRVMVPSHSSTRRQLEILMDQLETSVYRKTTHTDKYQYLHFNSHHPLQHKRSVARTLLDRAKNIPSTDEDKKSEVQNVMDALKTNGYTDQFLKSCQITKPPNAVNQPQNNQPKNHRGFVTLPYFQGISEKIARTLKQFGINVAHKPVKTVGSILKKPKDKFDQDLSTGVVYKINCKNCEKLYIGQTSKALRSRRKEHK